MAVKKKTTDQMISVDAGKLSQGLKTTFEGVAMVFDSLGIPVEMPMEEKAEQPEPEPVAEAEMKKATAAEAAVTEAPVQEPEKAETVETPENKEAPAPATTPEAPAPATPSVSLDDITRIIVQKIKQNRKNNEAIGAILKTYGVARVGDLPADKYEAFLTDLSAI